MKLSWKVALCLAAFFGFFLGPIAWQFLTSLWPEPELLQPLPSHLTLDNYRSLFAGQSFIRVAFNSLLVSSATTLLCIAVGALAAFGMSAFRFRFQNVLLGFSLAISMFPPIATVSPLYLALRAVGLTDSLWGLVLPYATFALPLTLWVLTSFFRQLPSELYRAARVDGCTRWEAFWHVILPVAAPGVFSTALLVFIFSWNEFLYALTFISSPDKRTIPVAISLFATDFREPWGQIAAASVLATLPLLALTLLFQRHIVAGLTSGAVKE
jgi:multiple sugar transport system permease protein